MINYTKKTWVDYPNTSTPITASELNTREQAFYDLATQKLDVSQAQGLSETQKTNARSNISALGIAEADEIGINLFTERMELGELNTSTGELIPSSSNLRSVDYIPVNGNSEYYFKSQNANVRCCWYDKDYAFISSHDSFKNTAKTSPSNAAYMLFRLAGTYGTTYNYDICVNRSNPSINGTYYPFRGLRKQITEVSNEALDIKMLGWSVPANMGIKNTMTAYGLFQQNVGRIKIKMHTWNTTAAGIFYTSLTERTYGNGNFNVTSNNYPTHTISHSTASNIASLVAQYGDGIYINSGSNAIFIADSRYSTNTQFVNAAGDEYLYYELASKPAAINIDGNEATLPEGIDDASGLTLASTKGTISNLHMVKIGKLVNISFVLTQTEDIASGDTIVSGLPNAAVNVPISCYTSASAATHSTAIVNTNGRIVGYFTSASTKTVTINATYITT